jgi:hypothetical protein
MKIASLFYIGIFYWLLVEDVLIPAELSTWQCKNRLQWGVEYDNNVYEADSSAQAEPSCRLLFQSSGNFRRDLFSVQYNCSIGYQGYAPRVKEDKAITECSINPEFKIIPGLYGGVIGWFRFKSFQYRRVDYYLTYANPYLKWQLPCRFQVTVNYIPQLLNYLSDDSFNYHAQEFNVYLCHFFSRKFSIGAGLSHSVFDFDRRVITAPFYIHQDTVNVFKLTGIQRDYRRRLAFNILYSGKFLSSLNYYYEINHSNGYGFSFNNQWLTLNFSKKFPLDILLRVQATYQKKAYQDSLNIILQTEKDTEKVDSNYLIVDISRSFSSRYSLFFRLSLYRNESPYRLLYYYKNTTFLGLEYRL